MHKTNYFILYIIFCVGFIGHLFSETRQIMLTLTPIALLITNSVVLISFLGDIKLLFWSIIVLIAIFCLQVIGVKSNLIFGELTFGNILGYKLFNVPIVISFNLTLIVIGSLKIARYITRDNFASALIAAIIFVVFNFFLEATAAKLNYWSWKDGIIPLQNYFAWFLFTFIFTAVLNKMKVRIEPTITVHYFVLQLVFFIVLSFYTIS